MAEREGFVFYRSFYEAIRNMDDATCAACFRALCEYGLNGVDAAENPIAAAILIMAKPQIDRNNEKYENGKKGGRPKKPKDETENQTETKAEPNENQTETKTEKSKPKEKEKVKEKEKEKVTLKSECEGVKPSAFAPPSVEEVKAYCAERGNKVDAERFVDYYTANGWMYGKTRMKDWKAVVRNWEKQDAERVEGQSGVRQQGASAQPRKNRFCNYTPSYTDEDFVRLEELQRQERAKW